MGNNHPTSALIMINLTPKLFISNIRNRGGGKRSNYTEILSYIKLGGGNLSLDIWVIVDLECRGRGVVKKSTIFCGRH